MVDTDLEGPIPADINIVPVSTFVFPPGGSETVEVEFFLTQSFSGSTNLTGLLPQIYRDILDFEPDVPEGAFFNALPADVLIDGTGLFLLPQVGGFGGLWFDEQFAGSGFNFIASEDTLSITYFGFPG